MYSSNYVYVITKTHLFYFSPPSPFLQHKNMKLNRWWLLCISILLAYCDTFSVSQEKLKWWKENFYFKKYENRCENYKHILIIVEGFLKSSTLGIWISLTFPWISGKKPSRLYFATFRWCFFLHFKFKLKMYVAYIIK